MTRISPHWFSAALLALFLFLAFAMPVAADSQSAPSAGAEATETAEDGADDENSVAPAQDSAWEAVWVGQREMINDMRDTALRLSGDFSDQTKNLADHLRPFDEEARRLLVFANTFAGHPNPMEAVSRRIGATINDVQQVLRPLTLARSEAEDLLSRVNYMAANLPDDVDKSQMSEEMRAYINDISRTRLRLTAVLAQYDSLLPSLELVTRLQKKRDDILAELPRLWANYYTQAPIAWLDPANWINLKNDLYYSWQAMILRLPVELPGQASEWGIALLRFCMGLFFSGVLCLIARRRLLRDNSPPALAHLFRYSLPWFVTGFALVGGAIGANGDFYRLFLAIGGASLLLGLIYLSWDLRRIENPKIVRLHSPFLHLLPLALSAYALLYLPLTSSLALVIWLLLLAGWLLIMSRRTKETYGHARLEAGVMDCEPIIIWACIFLAMTGLSIYSMLLYLAFMALGIACEFSLAGMSIVGAINEHLPQEGIRAGLARLLVALAAPCVLVLAVAGICLWVAMLPGGTYLLGEYAFRGIRVGATQLNIIQALLIISAFYLTRTIVAMGSRLLTRLPKQGVHFDATLITPMQTFLTYAAWAIFGLFALRALGLDLKNLALVAGGLSVGVGLGMQNIVNNFLSGLVLIFGRTLRVGDVVEVGNLTGRVRKISVRSTMVETYDNAIIYVPNSEFMSSRLINWTSFSRSVRKAIPLGVAYGSDTEKVIKLLIEIAGQHENVLKFPTPTVLFMDFGSSTLNFELRFWVKDYDLGASTMSDIRLAINDRFHEENIEIAFPQLDVHLKNMPKKTGTPVAPPASPSRSGPMLRRAAPRRKSPQITPARATMRQGSAPAGMNPDARNAVHK